jgi:hypothetical protein
MDVTIQDVQAQIGSNGILLRISEPNGGAAVGRLRIGKATLKWYKGKTSQNYKAVSMEKFIDWLNSLP